MKELSMNNNGQYIWLDAKTDDGEIPAWKRLDIVTRKWAALTGMEKDLSDYQKMKEMYQ
jgi:hypothetical protein